MTTVRLVFSNLVGVLIISLALAAIACLFYRRELVRAQVNAFYVWCLPGLRSLAIVLIGLSWAEPTLEYRQQVGEPSQIRFVLDDSQSMAGEKTELDDGNRDTMVQQATRFEKSTRALIGVDGLIARLQDDFAIQVYRGSDLGTGPVFESLPVDPGDSTELSERTWVPEQWEGLSPLGDWLKAVVPDVQRSQIESEARDIIVLLSDGRHVGGQSPLRAVESLQEVKTPLFTIGVGEDQPGDDLAIFSVEAPDQVFRNDTWHGKLVVSDSLPPGTPFIAKLRFEDHTVWEQRVIASQSSQRELQFDVSMNEVFDLATRENSGNVDYSQLPLKLVATLESARPEANLSNNQCPVFVNVVAQKLSVLVIDDHSRWEIRYLKNMFTRDPGWECDVFIANQSMEHSGVELPKTREVLFNYNLVILGDVSLDKLVTIELLPEGFEEWLLDFVEIAGGGVVLIDGGHNMLHSQVAGRQRNLLPVQLVDQRPYAKVDPTLQLTPQGQQIEALQLTGTQGLQELQAWNSLPAVNLVAYTEPLPGSQVLAELRLSPLDAFPLLVSRQFGAGKILYLATDETWKWRYRVADEIHRKLWNQLSRWAMRTSLSVRGEFLSLDTGSASYSTNDEVLVRCQLRTAMQEPATDVTSFAIIYRDGQALERLPLVEDPNLIGQYAASLGPLSEGEYAVKIEAAGFSAEALNLESKFNVVGEGMKELQRITRDSQLLRSMSQATGGEYLPEEEIASLPRLLRPFSSGQVLRTNVPLWQNYTWFSAIIFIVLVEWLLRKRAGLI
ncbi:MAG: VWA domain-containing protein [Planctomycetales bacterium]|nr:VWA domain-containing protein [Planctomycetales bacterium]